MLTSKTSIDNLDHVFVIESLFWIREELEQQYQYTSFLLHNLGKAKFLWKLNFRANFNVHVIVFKRTYYVQDSNFTKLRFE